MPFLALETFYCQSYLQSRVIIISYVALTLPRGHIFESMLEEI